MKKIILIVFTFLFLVSCSKDDPVSSTSNSPPPNGPNEYGITLKPTTHEFKTPAELSTISSASANSISFSSDPQLKTGDVIICGISSATPDGLIKKITGSLSKITGGTTYSTTDASLSDAVKSGKFEFNKSLFNFNQSFNQNIYTGVNISGEFNENLNLSGFLDFNSLPKITGNLNFVFSGTADINLYAGITKTFNEEKVFYTQSLGAIPIFPSPPIIVTPVISLYAKLEGNIAGNVSTGVTDSLNLTASISYDGSQWKLSNTGKNEFKFKEVKIDFSSDLKFVIGGSVKFLIYGTLGPTISCGPYSRIHSNLQETPIWSLYAGMDLDVGVSAGWLSLIIPDQYLGHFPLWEKQLASGGSGVNRPPFASFYFTPNASSLTTSTLVVFSASTSTDDKTPQSDLKCRWDFEGDGYFDTGFDAINVPVTHTYSIAGTYYPVCEVKDGDGATARASMSITIKPSISNLTPASNPSPPNGATVNFSDPFLLKWDPSTTPSGEAIYYEVYISPDNVNFNKIITSPNWIANFVGAQNYVQVGWTYFWKVHSYTPSGKEVWSPVWKFTTNSSGGNKTLTLQPGPSENQDVWIKKWKYPNGQEVYPVSVHGDTLGVQNESLSGFTINSKSLIKFNISNIPQNSKIVSASLKLYGGGLPKNTGVPFFVTLNKIISSWNINTLTWINQPVFQKIVDKQVTDLANYDWRIFDVTSIVESWIKGESSNYGFELTMSQEGYFIFVSGDSQYFQYRPILEIIYQ